MASGAARDAIPPVPPKTAKNRKTLNFYASADFFLPSRFGIRRKIVSVFGRIQEDTRQGQALDRRQFQRILGNLGKHFHLIMIRLGFLYCKRSNFCFLLSGFLL